MCMYVYVYVVSLMLLQSRCSQLHVWNSTKGKLKLQQEQAALVRPLQAKEREANASDRLSEHTLA